MILVLIRLLLHKTIPRRILICIRGAHGLLRHESLRVLIIACRVLILILNYRTDLLLDEWPLAVIASGRLHFLNRATINQSISLDSCRSYCVIKCAA